jgi:hypothetical protein
MTPGTLVGFALVAVLAVSCASPEATRVRAQGRGADVGNVGRVVKMHEGSDPYWHTRRLAGIGGPDLESSRQAARLSR